MGSTAGLATTPAWIAEGMAESAFFGVSVGTAGDVNGDSFSDVIVGALYFYDDGDEGMAFVYHGSAAGLAYAWGVGGNQPGGSFGCSVATAGDVNGDGYSDVIVGAASFDNGETNEGRAFVYHGSPAGLAITPAATAPSHQLMLGSSSPNPFDTSMEVPYTLPQAGSLRLAVYDVLGREVAVLANGVYAAGRHTARWGGVSTAGMRLPVGVYFLRLDFAGREETQKIVIAR